MIASVRRWQQENKEHLHAYRRDYRQRRKVEERNAYLLRNFGITNLDYDEILGKQGSGCAICGRPPRRISLHVDHDPESGAVRGLLCVGCNNALGQFRDSTELLARASSYVTGDLLTIAAVSELDAIARARAGELARAPG